MSGLRSQPSQFESVVLRNMERTYLYQAEREDTDAKANRRLIR